MPKTTITPEIRTKVLTMLDKDIKASVICDVLDISQSSVSRIKNAKYQKEPRAKKETETLAQKKSRLSAWDTPSMDDAINMIQRAAAAKKAKVEIKYVYDGKTKIVK